MTSPISRTRARLAEPPARDVGPVVVRVAEVILRLHLDQRAPHALHVMSTSCAAAHGLLVALVVAGAPDIARRIAHRILNATAALRARGLARG